MKKGVRVIIGIIIFLLVFCGATYFLTPLFMVHPNKSPEEAAMLAEADGVSSVSINDGLNGWFIDDETTDDLIIYFGGMTENASSAALRFLENATYFTGFDIAIIDWPGYGLSEGNATAESLRDTALKVVDYYSDIEGDLIVFGYSMGTGPAVYAASKSAVVDKLVLMSPYASAYDLYNNVVPIFYGPMKLLLPYKMNTAEYAADVDLSPLIITSKADKKVPYKSSIKLAEVFKNPVIVELDNLQHSEYWESRDVMEAIRTYLCN